MTWKDHVFKPSSTLQEAFKDYATGDEKPEQESISQQEYDPEKAYKHKILRALPQYLIPVLPVTLTEKETELLYLLSHGLTCTEIAEKLDIPKSSVYETLSFSRRIMGAQTTEHLIRLCMEKNLI